MAKSVEQLNQQIAKLQQQVEAVRAKEAAGVIKRIREAIEHYALTPEDLFGTTGAKTKRRSKSVGVTKSKAPAAKTRSAVRRSPSAGVKLPAKYSDDQGNSWTGRGTLPRWLRAAIDAGKTREDFAIKS